MPDIISIQAPSSIRTFCLWVQKTSDSQFENKNWSNCYFPKDLSHYTFSNADLTNADFSLIQKLFNTMFDTKSNLQGADFSNTNLQGSVFYSSDLSHTNFENADFSADNWEEPFLIFSL